MGLKKLEKKRFTKLFILSLIVVFSLSITKVTYAITGTGTSTDPYSVSQAMKKQDNTLKTVQGYIIGQPISNTKVLTKRYTTDTAIAIADNAEETKTSNMIYVKLPTNYRDSFGLKTNPSLKGTQINVTGYLTSYFSHDGLKDIESITKVNSTDVNISDDNTSDDSISEDNTSDERIDEDNSGNNSGDNEEITEGSRIETTTSYDSTYYENAIGKTGTALKSSLHEIIDNNKKLSYAAVWEALMDTDEDPNHKNNVILLYTGRSQPKATKGSGVDNWNREHVWAKSHGNFGTKAGPGTDLHHLRPADVSVNSTRGNLDFDNGGVAHSEATLCKYDNDSWEPRDSVKGDVARMLFYMDVRYEGDNGEIDLELNDKVNNGFNPYFGKLSTLLKWNMQDPVDEFERRRNEIIYKKYQHNRNPFIDHPEWVNQIWG
ncbi:endonuclease [Clostridium weizhouense]|uniref:Endonuclease n=1 Tax=Clostridium weizhouense TaxID=2859781 RepID=A0ABS7ASG8_9CLOT|nr:endonuclease [Clostridium weizhouense]MBW6411356.1 endonuclease [Clostridium weizhouense]